MANITDARVTITANKVGAELQAYIEHANDNSSYNILDADFQIEKKGDNWQFFGRASGRWAYRYNLAGYFGEEDNWFGLDSEESQLMRGLKGAIVQRDGSIDFAWTDCDPAMDWITKEVARLGVDVESGRLSLSGAQTLRRWSYTLGNLMEAFDLTLEEAIVRDATDDYADVFWLAWRQVFGDGVEPSTSVAEEWLAAVWEAASVNWDEAELVSDLAKMMARVGRVAWGIAVAEVTA